MVTSRIDFPINQVVEFCQRWQVNEFALFGSVLRDDFRPDSDVDVLVSFKPAAPWSLFDLVTMQDELQKIFGRPVDLVEREGLRNPFRKRSILNSRKVIYASPGT
jgi:predicted nucleotidyltransferase